MPVRIVGEGATCCCFCCPVRSGAILITSIWLILSLLNILSYSWHLYALIDPVHYDSGRLAHRHPFGYRLGHEDYVAQSGEYFQLLVKVYTHYRTAVVLLACGYLFVEVIQGLLSVFSIHTILQGGPSFRLFPWIVFNSFCLTVSTLSAIIVTFYVRYSFGGGVYGTALATCQLAIYGVYFYLIRVVYEYMKELRKEEEAGGPGDGNGNTVVIREPVPAGGVTIVFAGGNGSGSSGSGPVTVRMPPQMQIPVMATQYGKFC